MKKVPEMIKTDNTTHKGRNESQSGMTAYKSIRLEKDLLFSDPKLAKE